MTQKQRLIEHRSFIASEAAKRQQRERMKAHLEALQMEKFNMVKFPVEEWELL